METHVKVIGILHIALGCLGILLALGLLLLFGGVASVVGLSSQGRDAALAAPVIGGIGGFLFLLVLLLSLPGVIGGVGLVKFAPWSRMFMIVISAINLLNVPFGTALGVYGLWALTKAETEALFARRAEQTIY
jgi:hypothetical protein